MRRAFVDWLESKSFERQIVILAVLFDPIGFAAGYLAAPTFGIEPLMGGMYGLVAASLPLSMWIVQHSQ